MTQGQYERRFQPGLRRAGERLRFAEGRMAAPISIQSAEAIRQIFGRT
jgi:hypothetical protein